MSQEVAILNLNVLGVLYPWISFHDGHEIASYYMEENSIRLDSIRKHEFIILYVYRHSE